MEQEKQRREVGREDGDEEQRDSSEKMKYQNRNKGNAG